MDESTPPAQSALITAPSYVYQLWPLFFTLPGFKINIWTLTFPVFSLWLCGNALLCNCTCVKTSPETTLKTGHMIWHGVFGLVLTLWKPFFLLNLKVNAPFECRSLCYSCHFTSYLCVLQWWWCVFCAMPRWLSTATSVGSTPALWYRAAPTPWAWLWWETSRWMSTPSERICFLLAASLTASAPQVDHAKSLHYVGAGVTFPAGLLFVCLQCVLTYRVAVTTLDYWMAHFRVALTLGALVSLILSILYQLNISQHLVGIHKIKSR